MKTIKLIGFFLFVGFFANAQVKDISVTVSPIGEYSFWDNKAGLKDGFLLGGKVGFGFGEFVELRATYLQSHDLKTNFDNFGLPNYNKDLFTSQDVTLTRWGGEFKANIGTRGLMPYLTLGTGVQSMEVYNSDKLKQVYASLGLGLKLNLSERVVFLVEGKNTMYNFNSAAHLLTSADKATFGLSNADFSNDRLSNWAVQGALQFYLGGRNPGTLSELDEAYLNQFRGGLRGLQFTIEPGAAYIAFDKNSLFRDTWFVGGYAGLDFNKYIGLRGFYFQAVESMKLSTDFEKLSMYGVEFQARLNASTGITPYISLGGGYINPENNYRGKEGAPVKGNEFASGGLGLNIPLGKRVMLTGGAKAMLTSSEYAENIELPGDLQTHMMYNAGLKFTLGRKSKSTEAIYQQNLNRDVDYRMAENNEKIQQMKMDYQKDIAELEAELKSATDAKDVDKAVDLIKEKEKTQKALNEVEKLEKMQEGTPVTKTLAAPDEMLVKVPAQTPNSIQMAPAEFESLVVNILKATREESGIETTRNVETLSADSSNLQQIDALNKRLDFIEKLLIDINAQKETEVQIISPLTGVQTDTGKDAELSVNVQAVSESPQALNYRNTSLLLGGNVGGKTTMNLGLRLHYDIRNLPLEFMPEIYIGLGSPNSFGLSGNLIYTFLKNNEKVRPYAGAGLGFGTINRVFRGNYNLILGAQLPFISENLSVDYTMRNAFDYNQLAITYRLPF